MVELNQCHYFVNRTKWGNILLIFENNPFRLGTVKLLNILYIKTNLNNHVFQFLIFKLRISKTSAVLFVAPVITLAAE